MRSGAPRETGVTRRSGVPDGHDGGRRRWRRCTSYIPHYVGREEGLGARKERGLQQGWKTMVGEGRERGTEGDQGYQRPVETTDGSLPPGRTASRLRCAAPFPPDPCARWPHPGPGPNTPSLHMSMSYVTVVNSDGRHLHQQGRNPPGCVPPHALLPAEKH